MTNDISTLNGALQELGETMAANLVAMGVTGADASDGLTTLAGKILDIEPSVGGLDLTSEMSLTASSNSITLGQSVVLTATLTANYDDETLVNVDLHGYLQGATVSFKSGNTVIGTATTDVNGVATYTYTPVSTGTLSLTAVFAGTDNFSSATSSSVSVVVSDPAPASISVSSDKSVLSYYDEESATLTATVLDSNGNGCSGETVTFTFKHGSTTVETQTATTNSSGVATVSYSSKGAGDLNINSGVRSLVSESYIIEDCSYYSTTQYSTSSVNLNIPLPSAPFSLEYVLKQNNSNKSAPYIDIGASSNNRMLVGQYARAGTNGLITYTGSQTNYPYSANPTLNQENSIHFTYDGSGYTYWLNNLTPMVVPDKGITLSKLIHIEGAYGGYLKNIKIKKL